MRSIVVYTKDGCGSCYEAKQLLTSNDMNYTEKKIGVDIEQADLLKKYPGVRYVPVIVVDDEIVEFHEMKSKLLLEG